MHGPSSKENVHALFMCRLKGDTHISTSQSAGVTLNFCLHCSILLVTNMK